MAEPLENLKKDVGSFLQKGKALVVDTTSTSRVSIRKLLTSLGAASSNVDIAETYDEARTKISTVKPNIVFADYELGEKNWNDILTIHRQNNPSELQSLFFAVTSNNSATTTSAISDADIDSVLLRPFTFKSLQDQFIEVVDSKLRPSEYKRLLSEGKALFQQKQFADSLSFFEKARKLDEKPVLAIYYEGAVKKILGDADAAERLFLEGLKINPTHYRCMFGIFDILSEKKIYDKAYRFGQLIAKHYPIPPNRIPELITMSIHNKKYDDVENFYQVYTQLDVKDKQLANYLAAAFVICGKHHFSLNESTRGLTAFKRAELLCAGKPSVLKEMILALLKSGFQNEAEDLLTRSPEEVRNSPDVLGLILVQMATTPGPHILKFALEILAKGIESPTIYETAIKESIIGARPQMAIEDLVEKGSAKFPEKRPDFSKMFESYVEGKLKK